MEVVSVVVLGGPLKVTFVHLRNEDNMMALASRLNPKCSEFPSEPETGFQPTSERGSRKCFHDILRGYGLPEHCERLH